ncbi:tetratricopeptide repeat protein [Carboxylicivirga linearis]|uniref:Tetratricopeptide repeat protein n=1 Tax=Carboxylicivirga linearis TaxID=1628157 RepID=A0ABS5JU68_9BACT|nr:tetratricopeptide repeat protein [Carboxylicivirga linearis]MBS2098382.1 tetratricopeptide repeat protein [Carboxylicivirga linearis]
MKFLLLLCLSALVSISSYAQNQLNQLFSEERYPEIISQLESAKNTLDDDGYYLLAAAYLQSGALNNAIATLENFNNSLPVKHQDLLCKAYFETGQYPEALKICQDRYAQDSTHYGNLMRYAQIKSTEGQHDSTIIILNNYLAGDSLNYNANMLLAEAYQKVNEPLEAISIYKRILRVYPVNQKVGAKLAQTYYGKKMYKECFDLSMEFVDTLGYTRRFLTMAGLASFKAGNNGNTVTLFKRMEAHGDSSLITKKNIGIALYRMENYNQSLPYLYSAFSLKDDDPEVCFFLGASLGQTNIPLRGKPFLVRAASLLQPAPGLMEKVHLKLALMHEDAGDYAKAIAYYDTAYSYSPSTVQYLYNQAAIYDYELNNNEKAQELYKQFLSKLPDSLDTKKGKDLYRARLKEVVDQRLNVMAEEDFFRQGVQ